MKNNKKPVLEIFKVSTDTELALPFADQGIRAGFPSPAQDYLDSSLDLNKELIHHPAATFCAKVSGDSMKDAGLSDGDIVVIDKSIEEQDGDMVVCFVDGEFTIKYLHKEQDKVVLIAANENFPPITLTQENDVLVWGVVVHVIKSLLKKRKRNVRPC